MVIIQLFQMLPDAGLVFSGTLYAEYVLVLNKDSELVTAVLRK